VVLEIFLYGFITAFGWWSANHFVIAPHFPPTIEKKDQQEVQDEKKTDRKDGK
jgi:hypothetical protein